MINISVNGYKRISKRMAEKLYNSNGTIHLVPCKILPNDEGAWITPYSANKKETFDRYQEDQTFDKIVNSFEYCNCQYAETGKYTSFYVKEEQNNDN